jgi:hypothetical protein
MHEFPAGLEQRESCQCGYRETIFISWAEYRP